MAIFPAGYVVDTYILKDRLRLSILLTVTAAGIAPIGPMFLATTNAKLGLFLVQVYSGVLFAFLFVLMFALLLRIADKRIPTTSMAIAFTIINAMSGPIPLRINSLILESTPGGELAGVKRCMWIGACLGACAVPFCVFFVLPSLEEQARLDGGKVPTAATDGGTSPTAATAVAAACDNGQVYNPVVVAQERSGGRHDRIGRLTGQVK